ncbi:MAG: hypothetical protein AB1425_05410 [Actinomycetota bacterium]
MGENPWSEIEERKNRERDAKAGDELPEEKKGDPSSRLQSSREPSEDPEKRRVAKKLEERES